MHATLFRLLFVRQTWNQKYNRLMFVVLICQNPEVVYYCKVV